MMNRDEKRTYKNRLYEQFARIGKALSNPHRLELLELLMQCERTVEALAQEAGLSVANASQHLQVLRSACLVQTRREGVSIYYRLASEGVVPSGWRYARSVRRSWRKLTASWRPFYRTGLPCNRLQPMNCLRLCASIRSCCSMFDQWRNTVQAISPKHSLFHCKSWKPGSRNYLRR